MMNSPYDSIRDYNASVLVQMRGVVWSSLCAVSLAHNSDVFLIIAFALLALGEGTAVSERRVLRNYGYAVLGLGRIVAWVAVNPQFSDPLIQLGIAGWVIADMSGGIRNQSLSLISIGRNVAYALASMLLILGLG